MNTGSILAGRPSLGAWTFYGLGSENEELARLRRAARLSGRAARRRSQLGHRLHAVVYQGTKFRDGTTPILHLEPPDGVSPARQRAQARFRPAS